MEIVLYLLIAVASLAAGFFFARTQTGNRISELERRNAALETERNALVSAAQEARTQQGAQESVIAELRRDKEQSILQLNRELSEARARVQALQERLETQKQDFEQVRKGLLEDFRNLGNKVLKENSQDFRRMSQEQLEETLKPLREKLHEFGTKVETSHVEQVRYQSVLQEQIKQLTSLNQEVGQEAKNLASALKGDSKMQGNWGEGILETILERSGLLRDQFFFREQTFMDEEGNRYRPDVIVKLPGDKFLIIDSKVSLTAYEQYYNTEDPAQQQQYLNAHIASIRSHVRQLAAKDYSNLSGLENTPDYVLMFIPLEPAFNLALRSAPGLFEEALDKKIVLVTTTTLLATLVTVRSIWRQENQQRNVLEIARLAGSLYDKFVAFTEDVRKVGKQLGDAQKTYGEAMNKLVEGKGNIIVTAEKIRTLGAKTSKEIDGKWLDRAGTQELNPGPDSL
ncbi:MAG: DNA recombination protein RmuC [Bacteroidetes bacterium]|nr:DNA recombination protein RmuC [Bacteroidota bacterium]